MDTHVHVHVYTCTCTYIVNIHLVDYIHCTCMCNRLTYMYMYVHVHVHVHSAMSTSQMYIYNVQMYIHIHLYLCYPYMHTKFYCASQVSRCGMVYMEPEMLGWHPLLTSWLYTLPPTFTDTLRELIVSLYHRMVPPCLDFVRKAGFKVHTCTCM